MCFSGPRTDLAYQPIFGTKTRILPFDTVANICIYSDVIWTIEQTKVTHIVSDRKLSKTLSDPTNESDD